ncbi:hypothetical protein EV421DRAFT_2041955 [Armillaria borealis]|uniref:Uncharacterized protein n=1 Tax=Armillaria borealis TaxID=47425 RepID=A0AA39IVC5_9AGAR|nr:hypothetical protein EV421DRAFT_2041955 [Armillaria borealis]
MRGGGLMKSGRSLEGSELVEDEQEAGSSTSRMVFDDSTIEQADMSVQQHKILHPAVLINDHILHTHRQATVAMTHDDFEWSGLENSVRYPLTPMELADYAIQNNLVVLKKGVKPNTWVAGRMPTM